jgi:hypothetical protein
MAMVDAAADAARLKAAIPRTWARKFRGSSAILSPDDRKPFKDGSGRLELASDRQQGQPAHAWVMVNRVWQYHFGNGLVRTPGDFGRQE